MKQKAIKTTSQECPILNWSSSRGNQTRKRSTQCWTGKKKSKTIFIYRGHYFAYRKDYRNHLKKNFQSE